jgi:TPP-dependent 2-oxoacid decarboxylase
MPLEMTVARYLLTRLSQIGVNHLFGVPGDFVLGFLNEVSRSEVTYVGTCNELNAAYAADGYARIRGVGAFTSTFGVGELSAINGVAGAFAERVPIVAITGAPPRASHDARRLLHHTLGSYAIPMEMYEKITVDAARLVSAEEAPAQIDRVLTACLQQRRPVYLSLPSDMVDMVCDPPDDFVLPARSASDPASLHDAVNEAAAMLQRSARPIVIGGVGLIREGLQAGFADLLERSGYPYVTMMLAKGLLSERHPQFIGLYEGDRSRAYVRERVESADCVLQLAVALTDFNTGGFTARLDPARTVRVGLRSVQIGERVFREVAIEDFLAGLTALVAQKPSALLDIRPASEGCMHRPSAPYTAVDDAPLTVQRLFDRVSAFVQDDAIVLAETGVCLFSAAEMCLPDGATFIGQTFYGSIGYTVGATLGACVAAPDRPVVLCVGDGAFQVTCQDLSTMIRLGLRPVVLLLNNDGYTIERVIVDRPYNDLQPWAYHRLPEVFGGAPGLDVHTEGELERALAHAQTADGLVFIEVHTDRLDCPETLRRAGESMAMTNQL